MAKAVFITKVNPSYDDIPESRYHFPHTYLNKARETVGDWIVYYEPRSGGGRQVYFAAARVEAIDPDSSRSDHYYARISDYVEFPNPMPFRIGDMYFESGLRKPDGSANAGLFQRAIHHLPDDEYLTIVQMGMQTGVLSGDGPGALGIAEPEADYGRLTVERLVARPVRDVAFQHVVKEAYDSTCAVTGLKLINGGGSCEIEAAHIRPVADQGPDSPRNGIAFSRTFHWMFDRGLISSEDDGKLLTAKKLVPNRVQGMMNPDGYLHLPEKELWRPHSQFLSYHREHVYKG